MRTQVADGVSDKASARCKKLLDAGALRIRWPEDKEYNEPETFVWSLLLPQNWNKNVHLGWRWDPRELTTARAGAPPRAPVCY